MLKYKIPQIVTLTRILSRLFRASESLDLKSLKNKSGS